MKGKNLRVAVVGLGNVGYEVAKFIAIFPLGNEKHSITELVVLSREIESSNFAKQTLNGLNANPGMRISHSTTERLAEVMPDIVINCASDSRLNGTKDRMEMAELNLPINREISSQIPDDALEIIVTNPILPLAYDAVANCGRKPELTIGMAQVDSIRAGIAIEERIANTVRGMLDKSNIFIIGNHNDNEMVLAYSTATINHILLTELRSLSGKFQDIQKSAGKFAHTQIMARQTTNELTAKAVMETLNAVLTENSYVSAGVLCDFGDVVFKADPDYCRFEKPSEPTYMVMRTGFSDLKAGFVAGRDRNPEMGWFISQAEETKSAFYRIAVKQQKYIVQRNIT